MAGLRVGGCKPLPPSTHTACAGAAAILRFLSIASSAVQRGGVPRPSSLCTDIQRNHFKLASMLSRCRICRSSIGTHIRLRSVAGPTAQRMGGCGDANVDEALKPRLQHQRHNLGLPCTCLEGRSGRARAHNAGAHGCQPGLCICNLHSAVQAPQRPCAGWAAGDVSRSPTRADATILLLGTWRTRLRQEPDPG